jgi:hypothetical protein
MTKQVPHGKPLKTTSLDRIASEHLQLIRDELAAGATARELWQVHLTVAAIAAKKDGLDLIAFLSACAGYYDAAKL